MNIFETLKVYAQNRKGKLMYDAKGKAFLYHTDTNELTEITLYPINQFRPSVDYSHYKNWKEKIEKWNSSFDNIKVYSVQIKEKCSEKDNSLVRYGFINESGYAITHATYDKVEAFQNGHARVYLDGHSCIIDKWGRPILRGLPYDKADFVFNTGNDFAICCTEGKYGLINKYRYQCLPCEYDNMYIKSQQTGIDFNGNSCEAGKYVVMERGGYRFTALIEGNSITNILNFVPKSIKAVRDFLLIEENLTKEGNIVTKKGLLNRGGIRILNSEFDDINVVANNIGIVSKGKYKQLLFIGERGFAVRIKSSINIKYGEAYEENGKVKYAYAAADGGDIQFLESEDKDGLHSMENYAFYPENTEEYDNIYFTQKNNKNNYFAVVIGDKVKLVNVYGEEVFPLVIPSEYHVITHTYAEGKVGISKQVNCNDPNIGEYEETKYSFINSDGKILTDFIYDEIEQYKNGMARASYYLPHSYVECTLDANGVIIHTQTEYDEDGKLKDDYLSEWRDDAFEGDSEAYWNVD